MVGYSKARKAIDGLKVGQTAVIEVKPFPQNFTTGFGMVGEEDEYERYGVACEMVRQCHGLPQQFQEYLCDRMMEARVYNGSVYRLPEMGLCCHVDYEDKDATSYDEILYGFFACFRNSARYPIWIPRARCHSRIIDEQPPSDKRSQKDALSAIFPKNKAFIAYITGDQSGNLVTGRTVEDIGVKVKVYPSYKITEYEVDPRYYGGAFFPAGYNYTDRFIVEALHEACRIRYGKRGGGNTPVRANKLEAWKKEEWTKVP